jgi:excinuclease ABC subunit A
MIDLGPEGGEQGGRIVATGTPEQVARNAHSYTGKFLARVLNNHQPNYNQGGRNSGVRRKSSK